MQTLNIHEAKTHLSRLLARVLLGEEFVIAKAGRPIAKIVPYEERPLSKRRIGFMSGQIKVPDDFDTMCAEEIEAMFYGKE